MPPVDAFFLEALLHLVGLLDPKKLPEAYSMLASLISSASEADEVPSLPVSTQLNAVPVLAGGQYQVAVPSYFED